MTDERYDGSDIDSNSDRTPTDPETVETPATDESSNPNVPNVPSILDWFLGGVVALGGLIGALLGLVLFVGFDREILEAAIAQDDAEVEGMTEAEFIEVALSMVHWVSIGLLLVGLAMVALGTAYVVHRRRVHHRAAAGEQTSDYLAHALVGAFVSAVTSFIPLSPVFGGTLAGYLERGDSERTISVGAVSAVLVTAPVFVLSLFFAGGFATGFAEIGDGGLGVFGAVSVVIGGAFSLGVAVLVGAGGGWIGGKLAER